MDKRFVAAPVGGASSGSASSFVCGPTEAFPEYQLNDFRTWRAGGQLSEFLAGTVRNSSIDCLSMHIYSTYQITENVTGRDSQSDPFTSNYVAREVNNVDAILRQRDDTEYVDSTQNQRVDAIGKPTLVDRGYW